MEHWQKDGLRFMDCLSVKGKMVLDVGCGDGWASLQLLERGAAVTAMDILPPDHYKLNKIREENIPYIEHLCGVEGYDAVWSHHVLEHVLGPIHFLLTLNTVAQELWLTVPKCTLEGFAKDHINMYNMPVLVEHLRRSGWDVLNGHYNICPGPQAGALWAVVRRQDGFIAGDQKTYSKYPLPMDALNTEGENHLRKKMFAWNWGSLNQKGVK